VDIAGSVLKGFGVEEEVVFGVEKGFAFAVEVGGAAPPNKAVPKAAAGLACVD
jgi:hypothetical protein